MLLLYGYGVSTDIRNIPMVILDQDKTPESRAFIRSFVGSGFFTIDRYVQNPKDIDHELDSGRARAGIFIPPRFGRHLSAGRTADVYIGIDGSEPNTANACIAYISTIVAQFSSEVIARQIHGKMPLFQLQVLDIEPRIWYNNDLKSVNFIVPGLIATLLMMTSALLTSGTIARERELGTMEPLIASPIKSTELMTGKLAAYTLISFVDIILVLVIGRYWFGVPFRGSVLLLMGMSTIFLMSSLGLGLFISARSESQQSAMLIAFLVTMIPGLLLSGFIFPISSMPKPIQALTWAIPAKYFLVIVRSIFLKGVGMEALWPQALPMTILGVILFALTIKSFKKQMI
jgi:ABC-2 type transport system permease protein